MGIRPGFIATWTAAKRIYDPNDPIGKVKSVIIDYLNGAWGKPGFIVD